jgi:signal transduction histidine kinase
MFLSVEDKDKTKEQLVEELSEMRQRIAELETLGFECRRAEAEIKQRKEELRSLYVIAAAVSQSLDLREVLGTALKEVLEVLEAQGGIIYLLDESSQTYSPSVHHGISQDVLREVTGLRVGEGLSGQVAESGEALVVADIGSDPRNISSSAVRDGWRSYAGVPIKSKDKVLGVMILVSRQGNYFKPEHLGLLNHIGNHIGVAVENAQIYEKTRRAENDLRQSEERFRRHNDELEELVEKRTARIRELERQRTEIEKLGATGRMAARIAHEINNPLAGIKNSFLLVRHAVPEDHPYYEYVGRIQKEIDRIAWIVRQMFDLYRPDQEPVRESSVDEVISDIVALLDSSCREYGVSIEIDTSDAPAGIATQDALLRQILYNVVQNGIEASSPGGVIKIVVSVVDNSLVLKISDQGPGIPKEARFRIFEPFFTTKSGLTTGGLGLGLSVSKSIVEAMGGSIDFESETGQGTTFTVTLPLDRTLSGAYNSSRGIGDSPHG